MSHGMPYKHRIPQIIAVAPLGHRQADILHLEHHDDVARKDYGITYIALLRTARLLNHYLDDSRTAKQL